MMNYLPILLKIKNKKILLVGGGNVALQKIEALEAFTTNITIVANHIIDAIKQKEVKIYVKEYERTDLQNFDIVYACTNINELNKRVRNDAKSYNILVNIVDTPALCDFVSPAIYTKENITISVGSDAKDVRKSIQIRNRIKEIMKNKGKVYLIGFGIGDVELITVKAQKRLKQVDVICYDDLLDENYLHNFANAQQIYVGKRKKQHSKTQNEINQLLYQLANEGKQVARLKGGDPLIFGRGGEELKYLKLRNIEVEIIPGVTTASAAAAYFGIPLTHRGISSSVAFAAGYSVEKITVPDADTLVYYMCADTISIIAEKVLNKGWDENTPIALMNDISLPSQNIKISTLKQVVNDAKKYPSPLLAIISNTIDKNFLLIDL